MSKASPTSRTLAELRKNGWTVAVVERWNPHARIRQDLFGCIDLIAIHPERGIMGVQATSDANVAARITKSKSEPRLRTWFQAGGRFCVVGWKKRMQRTMQGSKRELWSPRWIEIEEKQLSFPNEPAWVNLGIGVAPDGSAA